jgi:hypothetical protein
MKNFIKKRLREQMIDGQNMGSSLQTLCNTMTVDSHEEALKHVESSLKQYDDSKRYELMQKLHVPLENLKQEQNRLNAERKSLNMTGDSVPDEANTYWHQIQSILCEQGNHFQ